MWVWLTQRTATPLQLYALSPSGEEKVSSGGWDIFSWSEEYERLGLPGDKWRISEFNAQHAVRCSPGHL